MISLIIVTYNRLELFSQCIKSMIESTKDVDKELIIWDNGSSDGTIELIKKYEKEYSFIKSVLNDKNIGVNAKSKSFELAKGDYIAFSDDDVIKFPDNWVTKMIRAFESFDRLGYLALDVVRNEHTQGAKLPENEYKEKDFGNNVVLQFGAVGGWCFMVPRHVYKNVGPLRQSKKKIFFGEDGDYVVRCYYKGYESAILKGVKCFHATGPYYNKGYEKIFDRKISEFNSSDFDYHKFKRKLNGLLFKIKKYLSK